MIHRSNLHKQGLIKKRSMIQKGPKKFHKNNLFSYSNYDGNPPENSLEPSTEQPEAEQIGKDAIPLDKGEFQITVTGTRNPEHPP